MTWIDDLCEGRKYTFYEQYNSNANISTFQGRFLEIRKFERSGEMIYIARRDGVLKKTTINIIPLNWIIKVETLEDILQGKTILISDVLRVIEEFV